MVVIECTYCGVEYEEYPSRINEDKDNFCSPECHKEWQQKDNVGLVCSWCGDKRVVPQSHPSAQHISNDGYSIDNNFCDKECESQWKSKHWTGKDHPGYKEESHIEIDCMICGSSKEIHVSELGESKYCSRECQIESQRVNPVELECDWCDREFTRKPHNIKSDTVFCSDPCFSEWLSEQRLGEKNPAYYEDSTPEMGISFVPVRRKIFKRDGYKCKICNMTREDHYEEYNRDLAGHHIIPRRKFDNVDDSNYPENMVTLCMECHGAQLGVEGEVVHPDTKEPIYIGDLSV